MTTDLKVGVRAPSSALAGQRVTDCSASLLDMTEPRRPGHDDPRWQYMILWRYGALLLVVTGLLSIGFGAAGACGTAISLALLPIGFVSLVAGVVLPKIEGKFTAGPSGLIAEVLAVHELDQPRYVISGPALATETPDTRDGDGADKDRAVVPDAQPITIGDVWDTLDARGLRADQAGLGHAYFQLRGDRHLDIPNRGFMDWGTASDELLAVLRTWVSSRSLAASTRYGQRLPHTSQSCPRGSYGISPRRVELAEPV